MIGYKFIKSDMMSENGKFKWKLGLWKVHKGEISLCNSGYHACKEPLDSLEYVYGARWFIVEAKGKIIHGEDKFVAMKMRIIKEIPVKDVVVGFAIACARRSLKYWNKKFPDDDKTLKAIETVKKYMKGEIPLDDLNAARSDRSARSAWSVAKSIARSADRKWQNKTLKKLIKEAKE